MAGYPERWQSQCEHPCADRQRTGSPRHCWDAGAPWPATRDVPGNLPKTQMGWEIYPKGFRAVLTTAGSYGLPVYITEMDIDTTDDAKQLSLYKQYFPLFMGTSYVKGITIWGWINGKTWVSNTGLVNGTTPRSAMTWLMGELGRPVPPN